MASSEPQQDAIGWMLDNRRSLMKHRKPEAFYGPQSMFLQAIEELESVRSTRAQFEQRKDISINEFCRLAQDDRLEQLARLRISDDFDANKYRDCLTDPTDQEQAFSSCEPTSDQRTWYTESIDWLEKNGLRLGTCWSVADWRALSFVHDARNLSKRSIRNVYTERTPVCLAGPNSGRIVWLAAQRMPGPPLVTPHWWRLGLTPLGDKQVLLKAVHRSLLNILELRTPFHIRWWLEQYGGDNDWPERIVGGESAMTSAAITALALSDTAGTHPLLDGRAAVSASLPTQLDPTVWKTKLLPVVRIKNKVAFAEQAGIHCLVFETSSAAIAQKLHSNNADIRGLNVLGAETLEDAYELLLALSRDLRNVKQEMYREWLASHPETPTHPIFKKLSLEDAD